MPEQEKNIAPEAKDQESNNGLENQDKPIEEKLQQEKEFVKNKELQKIQAEVNQLKNEIISGKTKTEDLQSLEDKINALQSNEKINNNEYIDKENNTSTSSQTSTNTLSAYVDKKARDNAVIQGKEEAKKNVESDIQGIKSSLISILPTRIANPINNRIDKNMLQ